MVKRTARRSRDADAIAAQVAEAVAEQLAAQPSIDPVDETPAEARPLAAAGACRGEGCALKASTWSGRPIWQCPTCNFQTFDEAEAATRSAVASRSTITSADSETENQHG